MPLTITGIDAGHPRGGGLEARAGVEPTYSDLQSGAYPLCYRAVSLSIKREARASLFLYVEREKSLELSTSTLARLRSTN